MNDYLTLVCIQNNNRKKRNKLINQPTVKKIHTNKVNNNQRKKDNNV